MFETLSDRLTQVFSSLRSRGRLSDADIDATCREIRIALLEADVALPVVREFIARVRERARGEEVSAALNPAQQVIKIVHDELITILGGEERRLRFAKTPPTVIMLAGLQGSGKTTLAAKLALWLRDQGNTPLLVAADLQRPNAVQQLEVLGERAAVPVFAPEPGNGTGDPVEVARDSIEEARRRQHNVVIIDTAGRLGVDEEMMRQAVAIRDVTDPDEILFVVDAMIGQDAVSTAQAFLDGVGYDGVVLTKLDGDARGGAALSIAELTGRPVMFASAGEKLEDFDVFHPDRMASRILDMGDMLTLIEQAERTFDQQQAEDMAGKLVSGEGFTLEDFVDQLNMVRKLGPIGNLLGMLPGAGQNRELLSQNLGQGPGPRGGHRELDDPGGAAHPEDHQRVPPGADRGGLGCHRGRGQLAGHEVLRGPEDDAPGAWRRRDPRHAADPRDAPCRGQGGEGQEGEEEAQGRPAGRESRPLRRRRARSVRPGHSAAGPGRTGRPGPGTGRPRLRIAGRHLLGGPAAWPQAAERPRPVGRRPAAGERARGLPAARAVQVQARPQTLAGRAALALRLRVGGDALGRGLARRPSGRGLSRRRSRLRAVAEIPCPGLARRLWVAITRPCLRLDAPARGRWRGPAGGITCQSRRSGTI